MTTSKPEYIKKSSFLIVMCLSLLAGGAITAEANLLSNPGFEQGAVQSLSAGYPTGWLGWGGNGYHHDDAGQVIGQKAVVVWWGDTGLYQNIPVTAGEYYEFSCKMLTPSSDRIVQWNGLIKAEFYNASNGQLLMQEVGRLYDTDPVNTWKTVTASFMAPAGAVTGRIVLMFDGDWSGSGRISFDEASIVQDSSSDPLPDPVAHYTFNSGDASDSSGNNLNGSLVGSGAVILDGRGGKLLDLDGSGYVDCGSSSLFSIRNEITVSSWIKVDQFDTDWQVIVCKGDSSWRLTREGGSDNIYFACDGLSPERDVTGSVNVNDGQWHHVAGVYDGSKIEIYVDGVRDAGVNTTGTISTNSRKVYIGDNSQMPYRKWNGQIDDVRIYDQALSPQQISELAQTGLNEIVNPDFNQDGIVSLGDLGMFATAWQKSVASYDFQGDDFVDITDLREFMSSWLDLDTAIVISVNDGQTYQSIDGFGASLTDSSAWLIAEHLNPANRPGLMADLFDPDTGIGLSYLRQPMGTSDMRRRADYSYDDSPSNQDDFNLDYFSIAKDMDYIIPVVQEALAINPDIKIMASPWSPPPWMKTNKQFAGGSLRDNDNVYSAYADYFVEFIQAYQAEGIPIDAVTLQNEAGLETGYPSLNMTAADQARFAKVLGPRFAANGISTKIAVYDWNWWVPGGYEPLTILGDSTARSYIDGVAWHHYGGNVSEQTTVRNAWPSENVYFTEGALGTWMGYDLEGYLLYAANLIVDTTRNWAKTVVLWNMALYDPSDGGPIVNGYDGCWSCYGVVTIDKSTRQITKRPQYYALGHASKFVKGGALRVGSNDTTGDGINSVVFRNTDGSYAAIAVNNNYTVKNLKIEFKGKSFVHSVPARSVATFTWEDTAGLNVDLWITTGDQSKLLEKQ